MESQSGMPRVRVIGPLGETLTLDALPPADTVRWTVRRKAEVVAAVAGALLSVAEACSRYRLTPEELDSWRRHVERSGLPGLRVTRLQYYRARYRMLDGPEDGARAPDTAG